MRLNPHLAFNGQCREAFEYYERCLGGKITTLATYGETPAKAQAPPDWGTKIIHGTLALGHDSLTGADAPPGYYQKPQGCSVLLNIDDPSEADRIYAALAEGGTVQMPIQETFWAKRFAMLTDRFGIPWMVNCGNQASGNSSA